MSELEQLSPCGVIAVIALAVTAIVCLTLGIGGLALAAWRARRRPISRARRDELRPPPEVPIFVEPPSAVLFAPDVRSASPDATTQPYPKASPPPTVATVRGDDFDQLLEQERAALRRRKEIP